MDKPKERPPFLPYLMVVLPISLAAGLAAIGWVFPLDDSLRIQAIWTLCALLSGMCLTMLLRHYELHKTITDLTRSIEGARQTTEDTLKLNSRMMRLERALHADDQFDRLAEFNDALGGIIETRLTNPDLSELIGWRTERIFEQAVNSHRELSQGVLIIDDEHKELNTNELLLRTLARKEIKAVSFEDEEFWGAPEGQEFLNAHEELIKTRGIRVRRLFVLDRPVDEYKQTLLNQIACGVEVKTITRDKAVRVKLEDFVIYDDKIMRTGYVAPDAGSRAGLHKYACVTWQAKRLGPYIEAFESLWRQGTRFSGDAQ